MLILEILGAVGVILLIIFICQRIKKPVIKGISQIPGPKPANDLEGNLDEIKSCGSLHQFLEKYHKQHGPIISFWFGPKMFVSIASSKFFQEYATYFDRPEELFQGVAPIVGKDTIQLANGEDGRRRHSAYSKSLNPTSVKTFYTTFNKLGRELVEKWQTWPVDKHILVQEEMYHLTIKSILETLFGEELENNELVANIKTAYDFCWGETEKYLIGDVPKPGSSRETQFESMKKTLDDLIRGILSNRRQLFRSEEDRLPIDAVLELRLPESTAISDMLTLFIAGFHTTALCRSRPIEPPLYFLATHQDLQNKVRAELLTVLGTSTEMTVEMTNKMKYLQQVLKESMRTSVIGTFAARVHHSDIVLEGFEVPAEVPAIHALGVSFHDESVFPNPLKFDPDRFSPENEANLPPFAFEPFGFSGKRKCPGFDFAYTEATVYLALLIRSFKIELAYDQVAESKFGAVTKMKANLWVIAKQL